ncbi:MAG: hypothetical protein GY894_06510 [Planctomycetes bacterium]|jgi:hypothetical protein|nr:hypothetical protein [Planctomycetota bacterium]MCP4838996.1 hypothetical protein [Planctomycetota bacterium]
MSSPSGPSEGLDIQFSAATREQTLAWMLSYRGDVTVVSLDGTTQVGYAFNQTANSIWLELADGSDRREIAISTIASVRFSGRDMAAGKSFDRWIQRYIDKKLAGEVAEIPSENV